MINHQSFTHFRTLPSTKESLLEATCFSFLVSLVLERPVARAVKYHEKNGLSTQVGIDGDGVGGKLHRP